MLKWIIGILATLILAVVVFLAWMGVFSGVTVKEMKTGPYVMVYQDYVGGYSTTGQAFTKVYAALTKEGLCPSKGIGIYLDDPAKVPAEKQRSLIGSILEGKDLKKLNQLRKSFKSKNIALRNSLVVELPIKNVLSYMIGPMKAYPELSKVATAKKLKVSLVMEIYDMSAKKVMYIMQYGE